MGRENVAVQNKLTCAYHFGIGMRGSAVLMGTEFLFVGSELHATRISIYMQTAEIGLIGMCGALGVGVGMRLKCRDENII